MASKSAELTAPADKAGLCTLDAASAPAEPWAVYLLACRGGKSYIGISPRPQERFEAHVAGRGAAFTRANPPETLTAIAWFADRGAAASMEARLKALARPEKLAWFSTFGPTSPAKPATLEHGLTSLSLSSP